MTLILSRRALEDARLFFEETGSRGLEGTGAIAGVIRGGVQYANRFVAPDQRASRDRGCSVEVTQQGKLQLACALEPEERFFVRIHSHPGEAFHSPIDDRNPFLTAEGSWSLVVPFFGLGLRQGIQACAIYRFSAGEWKRLQQDEAAAEIRVDE